MPIRSAVVLARQIVLGAFFVLLGGVGVAVPDELPTVQQVADLLRIQLTGFTNHHSVGIFEDRVGGVPTECSRISLWVDEYGRVKRIEEKGQRDRDGLFQPKSRSAILFNGELTFEINFNYDPGKESPTGLGEKTHVSIKNMPPPNGRHGSAFPLSVKNPLRSGGNAVLLDYLQSCLKANEPVKLVRHGAEGDGLVEIALEYSVPKFGKIAVTAVLDMQRGGSVKSCRITRPSGELAHEYEAEYGELQPGSNQWFATKGVQRSLLPSSFAIPNPAGGKPGKIKLLPRESRFECTEYRNDDPEFTDALFNVFLFTGTYVWDARTQKDFIQSENALIRPPAARERVSLFDIR